MTSSLKTTTPQCRARTSMMSTRGRASRYLPAGAKFARPTAAQLLSFLPRVVFADVSLAKRVTNGFSSLPVQAFSSAPTPRSFNTQASTLKSLGGRLRAAVPYQLGWPPVPVLHFCASNIHVFC